MENTQARLWTDRINLNSITVACNLPELSLSEFQQEVTEFLQFQGIEAKLTFVDVTPRYASMFVVRVEWDANKICEEDVLFACDAKGAYSVKQAASRSHYDR